MLSKENICGCLNVVWCAIRRQLRNFNEGQNGPSVTTPTRYMTGADNVLSHTAASLIFTKHIISISKCTLVIKIEILIHTVNMDDKMTFILITINENMKQYCITITCSYFQIFAIHYQMIISYLYSEA